MSSGQEAPCAVTRFSLSDLLDLSDFQRETALSLPVLQVFPFTLPRLVIVALSQQCPPVAGCQGRLLCYPDDGWMGCKLLCNTGMALGLFQDVIWRQGVVQLAPGDVLVLYTDGITEARDAQGEFFGAGYEL